MYSVAFQPSPEVCKFTSCTDTKQRGCHTPDSFLSSVHSHYRKLFPKLQEIFKKSAEVTLPSAVILIALKILNSFI